MKTLSTLTIGLNYGEPAGARKGQQVPLHEAQYAIGNAMCLMGIDCYTIIECKGYWQGSPECSLRVEVVHDDSHAAVKDAARMIRQDLLQEAVLLVHQAIEGELV